MSHDWLSRARRELERLQSSFETSGFGYCDFIVEAERRVENDLDGDPRIIDAPALPSHFRGMYVSNIPGIALPNGRFLFYCRASRADTITLLLEREIAARFRGASWTELFDSDYEWWPLIFEAEAQRRTLAGDYTHWRGKFAELQPGDRSITPYVPGVFAGDEVPTLTLSDDQIRKFVPEKPSEDVNPSHFDPTRFVLFLVDGFGVDLGSRSSVELRGGAFWWPASGFPLESQILRPHTLSRDAHQQFTGVLAIPRIPRGADRDKTLGALQQAQVRAKRLRLLINLFTGARVQLLGDVFADEHQHGLSTQIAHYHRLPYEFAQRSDVRQSRFPPSVLVRASEIALEPTPKGLLQYVHRALDSIELARTVYDSPMAVVLLWTAIEAIVSTERTEIINSVTMNLMGLPNQTLRAAVPLWEASKRSYGTRSTIVHSFAIPSDRDLREARDFASVQSDLVLRHALDVLPSDISRDELTRALRHRVLSRLEIGEAKPE